MAKKSKEEAVEEPKAPDAVVVFVNEKGRPTLHPAAYAADLLARAKSKDEKKARIVLPGQDGFEALSDRAQGKPVE